VPVPLVPVTMPPDDTFTVAPLRTETLLVTVPSTFSMPPFETSRLRAMPPAGQVQLAAVDDDAVVKRPTREHVHGSARNGRRDAARPGDDAARRYDSQRHPLPIVAPLSMAAGDHDGAAAAHRRAPWWCRRTTTVRAARIGGARGRPEHHARTRRREIHGAADGRRRRQQPGSRR